MKAESAAVAKPALYIVGTPIGNLEDVTLRALRVLKEVDLIACEDTRHTQKLLNHYAIPTRTISYHEHNEATRAAELVKQMQEGASVALVTDAGMPGVSDPGYRLVAEAISHNLRVIPVPGPSAFLSALVASGLAVDGFRFNGFLPSKPSERLQVFARVKISPETEVFYEAPHRLLQAVEDLVESLGESRYIVVAREMTKVHEEFLRGRAKDILDILKSRSTMKGEITLLIAKPDTSESEPPQTAPVSIARRVEDIMVKDNVDQKTALKKVAKERGISKSEAYRELQRTR